MKNIRFNMLLGICIFFLSVLLGACGGGGSPVMDEIDDGKQDGQGQKIVPPVADLMAEKTERAGLIQSELFLWKSLIYWREINLRTSRRKIYVLLQKKLVHY